MSAVKFSLGRTVATQGALDVMARLGIDGTDLLKRHIAGDWGDVDTADRQQNDWALEHDGRLMSVYGTDFDTKLYVITEYDRSVTTILTPREY